MQNLKNRTVRIAILLSLSLFATLPSLIEDSGLGILPIERGTTTYTTIKSIYELFGPLSLWTDYGNVFVHPIVLAYILFLFTKRKLLSLNWFDYVLMTVVGLISVLLTLGFLLIVWVLIQLWMFY